MAVTLYCDGCNCWTCANVAFYTLHLHDILRGTE